MTRGFPNGTDTVGAVNGGAAGLLPPPSVVMDAVGGAAAAVVVGGCLLPAVGAPSLTGLSGSGLGVCTMV